MGGDHDDAAGRAMPGDGGARRSSAAASRPLPGSSSSQIGCAAGNDPGEGGALCAVRWRACAPARRRWSARSTGVEGGDNLPAVTAIEAGPVEEGVGQRLAGIEGGALVASATAPARSIWPTAGAEQAGEDAQQARLADAVADRARPAPRPAESRPSSPSNRMRPPRRQPRSDQPRDGLTRPSAPARACRRPDRPK